MIGELPDHSKGAIFADRRELFEVGLHRTLQAGICGSAENGAESIVLSGGYPDDEDHGDYLVYTGHGGRDQSTGRQIADQDFTRGNHALVTSHLNGLPVRVIRGGKHRHYAPPSGYRYDGLYRVDRYWRQRGQDGFLICRFHLSAVEVGTVPGQTGELPLTRRTAITIQRIVRDTAVSRAVKRIHHHSCQVCGIRLECIGGPYAEGAHIRPLGRPHDGPDTKDNLLCLCPNHHVLFDTGGFQIADDLSLIGMNGRLRSARGHAINPDHLSYHRGLWPAD